MAATERIIASSAPAAFAGSSARAIANASPAIAAIIPRSIVFSVPGLTPESRRFALEIGQPALIEGLPPSPQLEISQFREFIVSHDPAPGVHDAELDQTLRNIGMLRNAHDRNEAIERCFRANQRRLAPYQAEKLLRAVSSTDYDSYHTYDRLNSIQRIVAEYLGLSSLSPELVGRAAGLQ